MKKKIEKLPSYKFEYENYEVGWWFALGIEYKDISVETFENKLKEYAIGYCESESLKIRPRSNAFAVMCEVNNCQFWFHVSKDMFF